MSSITQVISAEVMFPSPLQSGIGQGISKIPRITQVLFADVTIPSLLVSPSPLANVLRNGDKN